MTSKVLVHELPSVGKCLLSSTLIRSNQIVLQGTGTVLSYPTTYTIQLNEQEHFNVNAPLMYTSHSCQPNTRITFGTPIKEKERYTIPNSSSLSTITDNNVNTSSSSTTDTLPSRCSVDLRALHDIPPNTIVSFDYCTSEWRMASPFSCSCGAPNCRGMIEGYESLLHKQPETALALLPYATPYIQHKAISLLGNIYNYSDNLIAKSSNSKAYVYLSIQELLGKYGSVINDCTPKGSGTGTSKTSNNHDLLN